MQDIDFDELDRAVSSTMESSDDQSQGENITVSNGSAPAPAAESSAPARTPGRFMDVVHPSSDMRPTPERSAPRAEPERSTPPAEETPAEPSTPDTTMPDPLDFHGFNEDEKGAHQVHAPVTDESARPMDSPFLTDAKVEKRPLGAFSDTMTPAADTAPVEDAPQAEISATEEPAPEDLPPVPAELPTVEAEPTTPIEETGPSTIPSSITQQYTEHPNTADQPSGAIFDTESYHQPLAPTPKKKSGALVIIWIIALILVGAAAGAGVYFFVLPML